MSKYKIAIVNSNSFGVKYTEHIDRLKRIGEVERFSLDPKISGIKLAEKLDGFNIIISSVTPNFNKDFFNNKDELFLISRHGLGFNNVDIEEAKKRNVIVSRVYPDVEREAVAENTIANLMALIRHTVSSANAVRNGHWNNRFDFLGTEIKDKEIGIIGCGNIGSRVAEIFKDGFNAHVVVYDPKVDLDWVKTHGIEVEKNLANLLHNSDIISINASLTDTSYHILDKQAFSKMKKGVYITNTARGSMIVEKDLMTAIENGTLGGLVTDVMSEEPVKVSHPYLQSNKVIVTPHDSAYSLESIKGMGDKCVEDVERFVTGLNVKNQVLV